MIEIFFSRIQKIRKLEHLEETFYFFNLTNINKLLSIEVVERNTM